ncbi:MAG: LysR family transcriptional regulator [Bdellovibrionaceae bacterium]|nr:LysR family transcriptional regulator [Bdellovibrionales bacterium]MCB9085166.1 LysR family transcriptional regulator [Pseudobdellovibrionaceae bacterium]
MLRHEFEKYLVIFEEKSLSKAADRLDNYQGALSKILGKLEDEMGARLFVRSNRGLVPTEEGKRLYEQIQLQGQLWESYKTERAGRSDELTGYLRVGGHDSVLCQFTERLAELQRSSAQLEVEYIFDRSPSIVRMILNHELDLAFVANPQPFPDLVIKNLKKEQVALFSESARPEPFVVYNPDLISAASILKTFPGNKEVRLISAKDYDFAAILARDLGGAAILPEDVAQRNGLKKQVGKSYFLARLCLVYRADHRTDRFNRCLEILKGG